MKFFNAGMTEPVVVYDGERLLQVHTTNPVNDDDLYFVATEDEMGDEDFEDDIRFALRKKYGKTGPKYLGYEDVTELYCEED